MQTRNALDEHAVVDASDDVGLGPFARHQGEGNGANTRCRGVTPYCITGGRGVESAAGVAVVHEHVQPALVDQHVSTGGQTLAVGFRCGEGFGVRRVIDQRDGGRCHRVAQAVGEQ